jgi:hypothetical protein
LYISWALCRPSADGEASPKLEEILSAELVARPKVNISRYISRGPPADGESKGKYIEYIRDAPDTDLAGYPAGRISG